MCSFIPGDADEEQPFEPRSIGVTLMKGNAGAGLLGALAGVPREPEGSIDVQIVPDAIDDDGLDERVEIGVKLMSSGASVGSILGALAGAGGPVEPNSVEPDLIDGLRQRLREADGPDDVEIVTIAGREFVIDKIGPDAFLGGLADGGGIQILGNSFDTVEAALTHWMRALGHGMFS